MSVFAFGYSTSDILEEDTKVTDGIISSKTELQENIVTHLISSSTQHGNSGESLSNKQGNIVSITNAEVKDTQNIGHIIKPSYLPNLIDIVPITTTLNANNLTSELPFTEKIKRLTPVFIKIY